MSAFERIMLTRLIAFSMMGSGCLFCNPIVLDGSGIQFPLWLFLIGRFFLLDWNDPGND